MSRTTDVKQINAVITQARWLLIALDNGAPLDTVALRKAFTAFDKPNTARAERVIKAAKEEWERDDDCEIAEEARVVHCADGDWVQAWIWMPK